MQTPIYEQVITDMTRLTASIERRTIQACIYEIKIAYPAGRKRTKQTSEIIDLLDRLTRSGING